MNWDSMDAGCLQHFQRLGNIRRANPVIATGTQRTFDTHTALRFNGTDSILIRLDAEAGAPINIFGTFPEGAVVTELYTGQTATVENGQVVFPEIAHRIALLRLSL